MHLGESHREYPSFLYVLIHDLVYFAHCIFLSCAEKRKVLVMYPELFSDYEPDDV